MAKLKLRVTMPTVLKILNLIFIIHTRDHGYPHVTVYRGTPKNHDAFAKVRLDVVLTIELSGFSASAEKMILKIVSKNQSEWLEVWNETRETK
jgi:hypothetical protein